MQLVQNSEGRFFSSSKSRFRFFLVALCVAGGLFAANLPVRADDAASTAITSIGTNVTAIKGFVDNAIPIGVETAIAGVGFLVFKRIGHA